MEVFIGTASQKKKLKAWAEELIIDANTLESALQNNPNLQHKPPSGALDPEPWQIARYYARKIVAAVETGKYIEREWFKRIEAAMTSSEETFTGGCES